MACHKTLLQSLHWPRVSWSSAKHCQHLGGSALLQGVRPKWSKEEVTPEKTVVPLLKQMCIYGRC